MSDTVETLSVEQLEELVRARSRALTAAGMLLRQYRDNHDRARQEYLAASARLRAAKKGDHGK